MWIGTSFGLNRYITSEKRIKKYYHMENDSSSIPGNNINVIYEDSRYNLWVGAFNEGLSIYDSSSDKFRKISILLPDGKPFTSLSIRSFFEDSRGYYWVGSWERGLFRIDSLRGNIAYAQQFKYSESDPGTISGNIILSLNEDRYGNIWIGSPYGLDIIQYMGNLCRARILVMGSVRSASSLRLPLQAHQLARSTI